MRIGLLMLAVVGVGNSLYAQRNLGEPFVFANEGGYSMPYRFFTPPDAQDGNTDLPLVVFLHGAGERGADNVAQVAMHIDGLIDATQSGDYPAYLLAPQVPGANSWSADGRTDLTMEIIESLIGEHQIDTDRIYVTGLSMGGFGSFHYVDRYPDVFAAAVPMSAGYATGAADQLKETPMWMFHGELDSLSVDTNGSRRMFDAMRESGGDPILTEIALADHVIWFPIYADPFYERYGLYDWLFSQSRSQPQTPVSLIDDHHEWAYLDDGSDQGTVWREVGFDDSEWQRGAAPLGYGYGDETTVLACGPADDCSEHHATYYLRHEFTVEDLASLANVMAQFERDDGLRVYLNGEEIFRDDNVRSNSEFDTHTRWFSANNGQVALRVDNYLVEGLNTMAVELRQADTDRDLRDDLRFRAELTAWQVPEPSAMALIGVGLAVTALRRRKARRADS